MKLRGGYNIFLQGRPGSTIKAMPEPKTLYLPLSSKRFRFSAIHVADGQDVALGDVLATDPNNYDVPLLAPRAGSVRLGQVEDTVVLENIAKSQEYADTNGRMEEVQHVERTFGAAGAQRRRLMMLGAWQFLHEAHSGRLPDPLGTPQAVLVSTLSLEPFTARGDVQLQARLLNFTRGLEHLQSLLEYQPIYFVLPDIKSEFASIVRNHIRGYASVKMVELPLTYPYDDFAVLARSLGLSSGNGPVWALRTEGVLAVDRALTAGKPCVTRIISIGGTGVVSPGHLRVVSGYPLKCITDKHVFEPHPRIINGGIMTGEAFGPGALGIDTECRGITVLPELQEREFLGFMRPGSERSSYWPCFLSSMVQRFAERLTTAMRGERRPCISCNACEEVCPAGISPHLIHKYLYRDLVEEAAAARVDLCVECGLCSYVCPSKIDLRAQFVEAKNGIAREKAEMLETKARQESTEEVNA
ncbi:MAG: 4Fe-4S dicluster domain-containing protein [Sedimentisphaerales bacterium]|nr:4Fe-4S dicluster domain-containing protein [Sedimentisphaerales bacterium]